MNAFQIQAEAALVSWDPSDAKADAVRAAFAAAGFEDVCPKGRTEYEALKEAMATLKAKVAALTTAASARGKKARRPTVAKGSAWTKRAAKARAKLRSIESETTPGTAKRKPRRATNRATSKS